MSYSRSAVVKRAQSWIGCKESDGSHKKIIDVYNNHKPLARNYKVKYTDSWCATFVSAVSIKCGYTAIIPTECGCGQMIELFKDLGEWKESDSYKPSAGDVIFYDWDDSGKGDDTGWPEHVGIVEKVSGSKITVIEGNKSNAVGRRTIAVSGKYIRGYGVPKYGTSSSASSSGNSSSSSPGSKLTVDGQWGKNTTRRAQQVFGTTVDGLVSNQPKDYKDDNPGLLSETFCWEKPVSGSSPLIKAIQKKVGATQDGRIGPKTIKAMQKWLGTTQDGKVSTISPMVKAFQRWLNKQ